MPKLLEFSPDNDGPIILYEGDDKEIRLKCKFTANPLPQIKWILFNEVIHF
jgi:hypothetical protein